MKQAIAFLCRTDKRKAAALALPLVLLGAAALPGKPAAQAAMGAPVAVGFAQPQMADVIEAVQPAVVKISVVKTAASSTSRSPSPSSAVRRSPW